jgi:hypothetical protein
MANAKQSVALICRLSAGNTPHELRTHLPISASPKQTMTMELDLTIVGTLGRCLAHPIIG